jgi:hypothetical protein
MVPLLVELKVQDNVRILGPLLIDNHRMESLASCCGCEQKMSKWRIPDNLLVSKLLPHQRKINDKILSDTYTVWLEKNEDSLNLAPSE